MNTALPHYLQVPLNWKARGPNQGGRGGGQAGGKDGTGKGKESKRDGGGGKAGAFSDAGYANRENTGYRAGNGAGGFGGTKKAGNDTVAQHMIYGGQIGVPSIGPGGMAQGNYPSQDDAGTDFARAIGDYATRSWAGKIADFFGGSWYDQQKPISQNPRTFAQGTYHTSTNPAGALIGAATPYGMGVVTGPLAANVYNGLGGKNIFHGGYSQPDTGVYSDPSNGWSNAAPSGGLLGLGGGGQSNGMPERRGYEGGLLGLANQAATPAAPPMTTPASAPLPREQLQGPYRQAQSAGGWRSIPGPTPYGFTAPSWNYWTAR